jgi:hypothetical protein
VWEQHGGGDISGQEDPLIVETALIELEFDAAFLGFVHAHAIKSCASYVIRSEGKKSLSGLRINKFCQNDIFAIS